MIIVPSIWDKKLKKGWLGYVYKLDSNGKEVLARVYGKTLKEMRVRKHAISETLKQINITHAPPDPSPTASVSETAKSDGV